MATSFTFEPVVDSIAIGGQVSLSLDKDGNPGIVFSDRNSGVLFVAHRPPSGVWSVETVTGSFISGAARPRLAFDSTGSPQVAYRNRADSALIHGVRRGGAWSLTPIPTRLTPGPQPGGIGTVDFALHPGLDDKPSRDLGYFVYGDQVSNGVGFAHTGNTGPTPVAIQLDPSEHDQFNGPSASFDSSENFFVGYVRNVPTTGQPDTISVRSSHIVNIEQGTFSTPTVIDGSPQLNVRSGTSIIRTGTGGCVAYFDIGSRTVKASVTSGSFTNTETVASNVTSSDTPSAAAQLNAFRVAFADVDAIKLASRSNSGDWTAEVVEAVSGSSPSLAYDKAGTANIAYVVGSKLRFARRAG